MILFNLSDLMSKPRVCLKTCGTHDNISSTCFSRITMQTVYTFTTVLSGPKVKPHMLKLLGWAEMKPNVNGGLDLVCYWLCNHRLSKLHLMPKMTDVYELRAKFGISHTVSALNKKRNVNMKSIRGGKVYTHTECGQVERKGWITHLNIKYLSFLACGRTGGICKSCRKTKKTKLRLFRSAWDTIRHVQGFTGKAWSEAARTTGAQVNLAKTLAQISHL